MTSTKPVALVTGASSGIGRAARRPRRCRIRGGRHESERVNAEPLDGVTFLEINVASDESGRSVEEVIERFGGSTSWSTTRARAGPAGRRGELDRPGQGASSTSTSSARCDQRRCSPHARPEQWPRRNVSSYSDSSAPFMAITSIKHAIEGYSESVDHEVGSAGVRVSSDRPTPGPLRAPRPSSPKRPVTDLLRRRDGTRNDGRRRRGSPPDPKPKVRYTAGSTAGRVGLRRFGSGAGLRPANSEAQPPTRLRLRPSLSHTRGTVMGTIGNNPVISSYAKAPGPHHHRRDVTYAYRELRGEDPRDLLPAAATLDTTGGSSTDRQGASRHQHSTAAWRLFWAMCGGRGRRRRLCLHRRLGFDKINILARWA